MTVNWSEPLRVALIEKGCVPERLGQKDQESLDRFDEAISGNLSPEWRRRTLSMYLAYRNWRVELLTLFLAAQGQDKLDQVLQSLELFFLQKINQGKKLADCRQDISQMLQEIWRNTLKFP